MRLRQAVILLAILAVFVPTGAASASSSRWRSTPQMQLPQHTLTANGELPLTGMPVGSAVAAGVFLLLAGGGIRLLLASRKSGIHLLLPSSGTGIHLRQVPPHAR